MKGPPLGPSGEDIRWPLGAERRLVPETSNNKPPNLKPRSESAFTRILLTTA